MTMKENLGDDYYTLRIPNQEVWSAFRELTAFSLQTDRGRYAEIIYGADSGKRGLSLRKGIRTFC